MTDNYINFIAVEELLNQERASIQDDKSLDYPTKRMLVNELDRVWQYILQIPIRKNSSADVQSVKRGHWYHNTSKYVSELDAYFIQACCSCCGRYSDRIDQYSEIMSNETCSHCGADMRGEANG